MLSLFPQTQIFPDGFSYSPEFLSEAEESILVNLISNISLHTFIFQGFEAKRKVASFGYDYSFDKRTLTKGRQIPVEFDWLIDKVKTYSGIAEDIAELLITEYPPRSVINWHRDAPPFDIIIGISLSADCVFRFRPHDKQNKHVKPSLHYRCCDVPFTSLKAQREAIGNTAYYL